MLKHKLLTFIVIITFFLFSSCSSQEELTQEQKVSEFFQERLNANNYFEIFPPHLSLNQGQEARFNLAIINYQKRNLNATIKIDCPLNTLYNPHIKKMPPNQLWISPITVSTSQPGTYHCTLTLHNQTQNFSIQVKDNSSALQ